MSRPAYERVLGAFRSQGLLVDDRGGRAACQAPGHSPNDRSVSVTAIAGSVLFHCHSDPPGAVLDAVGLTTADLFDSPSGASYDYPDGRRVSRSPAKKFRQSGNTNGTALFHSDRIGEAATVYYVEGEKDVLAIEAAGGVAVCNAGGAGKSHLFDLTPLHGKTVVIVADKDQPGHKHAQRVAEQLHGKAAVRIVEALVGKDAADHIAEGHALDELIEVSTSELMAAQSRRVVLSPFADELDDVPVWAWEYDGKGRIPIGAVTLFAGRPGAGKSTAGRWLAASASTGTLSGCWMGKPINVAYLSTAEESAKYVVKPGLRAAGADLSRVLRPRVQFAGEDVRFLSSRDMDDLTDLLIEHQVRLVIVDPLMATIGAKTDINRNNEVRDLIEPWARLAERIDGAVIGIAHLNKSGNGDVVAGINGSSAFGEVARAVFGFAKDPESDDSDRIMSQEKNSIGEEDLAITYRIESQKVTTDSGKQADVGRFVVVGNSDRSVGEVLRTAGIGGRDESAPRSKEVDDWLLDVLSDGPVESNEIFKSAKGAGYSTDQVRRAKNRINKTGTIIEAAKSDGPWLWKIAGFVPTPVEPPSSPSCISSQVETVFQDGGQDSAPSSRWQLEIASDLEGSKIALSTGVGERTCSDHGTILGKTTGKCIDCVLESANDGIAS